MLLDQGFPAPPGFKPADLDRNIEYVPLVKFAPELSKVSTPDWMVILAASKGGFDAFVVDDQELRDNDDCLVALAYTKVSLVTWSRGIDDPVTAWAQLVAYMPKIRQGISEIGPSIFVLPAVRLTRESHILKPAAEVRKRAKLSGTTYAEFRNAAVRNMREELNHRKRMDLAGPLPSGRGS
jgi:hypothetical protein